MKLKEKYQKSAQIIQRIHYHNVPKFIPNIYRKINKKHTKRGNRIKISWYLAAMKMMSRYLNTSHVRKIFWKYKSKQI